MAYHKPISNRKAASSFINDITDINLIQLSPVKKKCHFEQSSSNTTSNNQGSRTNFIGNMILPTERPRAFAITKTGEKQLVDLDDSSITKTNSNLFTISSPRLSVPNMERISEKSSSHLSLTEKLSKSSTKCIKKPFKRHKYRLLCTPRNIETPSASRLSVENPKKYKINTKLSTNTSTETQTERNSALTCSPYLPRHYNKFTAANIPFNYIPMEGPKAFYQESVQNQQRFYNTAIPPPPPPMTPLKIYTKNNYNLRKYSELRNLACALSLIIVVSWLFSTFFDVECLWHYLDSLWQYFRNWFAPQEIPKTKMEILITFLRDMLS